MTRHTVTTEPGLIAVRVDESLYFANSDALLDRVEELVAAQSDTRTCFWCARPSTKIDARRRVGVLTDLERSLAQRAALLLLSDVKGPGDRLQRHRTWPAAQ